MLTAPIPEPSPIALSTNGDLLEHLLDYRDALRLCNANLAAVGAGYGSK